MKDDVQCDKRLLFKIKKKLKKLFRRKIKSDTTQYPPLPPTYNVN